MNTNPAVNSSPSSDAAAQNMAWRRMQGAIFQAVCLASTLFGLLVLLVLLVVLIQKGGPWLTWNFLTSHMSYRPYRAGILSGLWGSFWVIVVTAAFSIPVGVGAAVYLEEYARGSWLTRIIQLNLTNLAGVPSIVYGILGLTVFARNFDVFGRGYVWRIGFLHIPLPLQATVLTGGLTLGLLVLPVIIVATQEALRSVPQSLRHASLALGASQWQTIWHQVLPASIPGILTGVILALSRAIGETAPLIVIGVPTYFASTPAGISTIKTLVTQPHLILQVPFSNFTALPVIVYAWTDFPQSQFKENLSAAGILVLMVLLLAMNSVAIFIRQRYQTRIRW